MSNDLDDTNPELNRPKKKSPWRRLTEVISERLGGQTKILIEMQMGIRQARDHCHDIKNEIAAVRLMLDYLVSRTGKSPADFSVPPKPVEEIEVDSG